MIVKVTVPANTIKVNYGGCAFLPDENHQLDLPDYVAKGLLGIPNVQVNPALPNTIAQYVNAQHDEADLFELNYLFYAYGKQLPDEDLQAAATALFADRGAPNVSLG